MPLSNEEYQELIQKLTTIDGEDLINILHMVMQAKGGELFSYTDVERGMSGLVTTQFDIPPTEGTDERHVVLVMAVRVKQ